MVDLPFFVGHREQVGMVSDRFRRAEEQDPLGIQGVTEQRQHFLLQRRTHVDQQVPAADQVQP